MHITATELALHLSTKPQNGGIVADAAVSKTDF